MAAYEKRKCGIRPVAYPLGGVERQVGMYFIHLCVCDFYGNPYDIALFW